MKNTHVYRVFLSILFFLSVTIGFQTYAQAQGGRIIVANDDWTLSDTGFTPPNDPGTFAQNVASWFTGGNPGKFLVFSDHFGLTGTMLADAMTAAGHTWIVDTSVPFNLCTLTSYDGVFLGVTPADNNVLIDYVNVGGNVYVFGGGSTEPAKWNTFLQYFGLQFGNVINGLIGNIPINSSYPLFAGVDYLYHVNGTPVIDLAPTDPKNQVLVTYQGEGLFAIYDGAGPAPGVGGSVAGVRPMKVSCKNVTTGQMVIIRGNARSWDCEAAGLVVNSGDRIQQTITGTAD